ncbi:MAG: hypothetical protein IPH43_02400 [Xanthomonadales bacterium]|nr:hypothetical protein [Xanthomonadales bacterium]HQY55063.1 hypothetical protein [Dokdonella sp.]HQZ62158.1 hypothetical protein [Dokdonella sp.]
MKKVFFALTALLASSAWAQQNIDITAEQFNSGAANAELTTLGRQAAASGKRLVVTAPQHWHAQIAARIRAGGQAEIVMKDGFYETLLVRVEDKAAEPAKPEPVAAAAKPAPVAAPAPTPTPRPAPVAEPPAAIEPPPPAPVVEVPAAEPEPAPEVVAPPPPPPVQSAVPAVVEEAPAAAAEAPVVVDPKAPVMLVAAEPGDTDPVRESMEKRYNEGKRISERVQPGSLREGDVIYTAAGAAVIVRRENNRMIRMWLDGTLNLNQTGLSVEGGNKYLVVNRNLTR